MTSKEATFFLPDFPRNFWIFLISHYPDPEFLRECLGVFSHMEIFCSNKKTQTKHFLKFLKMYSISSTSFRKPSSFLGWSFHYLCHRVNLSKGTPITVNFPASDVFEMQSNLYDVYDYLNTSDLINHDTWRMAGSLGWMAKIGIIAFEKKHGRIW